VVKVQRVIDTVLHYDLITPAEYQSLLVFRLDSTLPGFRSGLWAPTMASLHDLIDENWLGERVIDARLDVLSRDLNAHIKNFIRLLDCSFHLDLENSFREQRLSRQLRQIREEILVSPPVLLAFLINKGQIHWAAAAVVTTLRIVLQGDSAGFDPHGGLFEMVRWWLRDAVPEDGEWEERLLPVEQQGPTSGSCALASVSGIMSLAHGMLATLTGCSPADSGPNHFTLWTNENSALVRREWLQVLLRTAISAPATHSVRVAIMFICSIHSYVYIGFPFN
jgi:hypothetical protein